jgi:hypothetical protein
VRANSKSLEGKEGEEEEEKVQCEKYRTRKDSILGYFIKN